MIKVFLVLQNLGRLPVRLGTHDASLDYMELTRSLSI